MRHLYLPRALQAALIALFAAVGSLAVATAAVSTAGDGVLYGGEPVVTSGVTLGSWGTGTVEENADEKTEGLDRSLKITTRDFYQGARLDIPANRQVDLVPILRRPNPYLSLSMKINTMPRALTVTVQTATGTAGAYGGGGGEGGSGGGYGTGLTGGAGTTTAAVALPPITKVRIVLVGQRRSLEIFSMGDLKPDAGGWLTTGIPLDRLSARVPEASFRVERVIVTGNAPDTLYVGKMALVNDDTEISVRADPERFNDIQAGKPLSMTASAEAGLTPIKVTWDFDSEDGIQEEAEGLTIKHTFPKPGRYTITATAKPADSAKKKAATTTFDIEVVP